MRNFHSNLDDETLGIVLDNKPWSPSANEKSDKLIRSHVENGTLRLVCNDKGMFRTMASLVQLRHLIFPEAIRSGPDVSESFTQQTLRMTANFFFPNLIGGGSSEPVSEKLTDLCTLLFSRVHLLGDLFESCVAMTVVSNSHRGITDTDVFGLSELVGSMSMYFPKLTVRLARNHPEMKWNQCRQNELVMAPGRYPAYDARVVVGNEVFYLQMKVMAPNDSIEEKVRRAVALLKELLGYEKVPKNVTLHFVWYVHTKKKVDLNNFSSDLLSPIKEKGYNVKLHVVSAGALNEWMIPSFRVIPWLIHAVDPERKTRKTS